MRSAESGAARTVTLVAVLALLLAAGTVIAADATGHLAGGIFADPRPQPAPTKVAGPTAPAEAPPVLAPVSRPSGPEPTGFAATLDRLLADRHLGPRSGALFVDALTGDVLYARTPAESHTPASVAKLLTSAAVLVGVGPDTRLTTRVRAGAAPNEVVLVGAGDASLTVARPRPDAYPQSASLAALAEQTATALRGRGVTSAVVRVDDGLFGGPAVSPDWQPSYVRSGVVAPVSALSTASARHRRTGDPAIATGQEFATELVAQGVKVEGRVQRGAAPGGAAELGAVSSPPLASLVETTLATSDNDMAEALARLAALAAGHPATFEGGAATVTAAVQRLGVPTPGLRLLDGSGLARGSAVAPETLARLLALAAGPTHPELRAELTGLPVAGFSGTLAERFGTTRTGAGGGVVRAKTGTLTGVSSLAGLAQDGGGRLVAFALLADRVPSTGTLAARDALDRVAAALAATPPKT